MYSYYDDIRSLDSKVIVRTKKSWHFSRALVNSRWLGILSDFAREVFIMDK